MSGVSDTFVVVLGISVVFIGLICIVILCKILSAICSMTQKNESKASTVNNAAPVAPVSAEPIQNRQEIVAAVSAAIAEDLGTDISAIRILSFKKI